MQFKVQTSSKQIGDTLEKYCNNCDISLNWPLFMKGEKEIRLSLERKKNVNSLKKEEHLCEVRLRRNSESEGYKLGIL